jgi:protein-disulfide isomerase/uncharacterized membrane protein
VIKRNTILIVLLFALAGAFLSGLLLLQHYNESHAASLVSMMCGGEATSGCGAVNRSPYAVFIGIPLGAFGLFFYLSLSLLLALTSVAEQKTKDVAAGVAFYACAAALAVDLLLLGIQAFSLGTYCTLCIASYITTAVAFVLLLRSRRNVNRGAIQTVLRQPEGKVVAASWLLGTLVLACAVGALNLAMHYQDPASFDARLDQIAYDEYQKSPVQNIDLQGIPSEGTVGAPVTIVVYSDFLCPWCRQMALTIQQHIKKWEPNVVVYYKTYPLDQMCNPYEKKNNHPGACWASLGGLCEQDQGLFWEYHDRMYNNPPRNPRPQDILKIGAEVGMDTVKMKECMVSLPMRSNISKQIKDARSVGVTGTPGIFINGKKLPRLGYFSSVLSMEAKRLGLPPLNATGE